MLLSYVFSFRNEEQNIPGLVRRVTAASEKIEDLEYELIFVNDDSSDKSLELLMELQRENPITVVNMTRRFGVTPCVLAGFAQARGDAVVYMDTDLQDPPELVPQLVEKFRAGADVVHTTRIQRQGEGKFKLWLTKQAYRVINLFSDIELPESTGDYKLLSARVVRHILELDEFDPYMRGLSVWVGYKQEFVYYVREPRFGGETKFPVFSRGPAQEFIRGLTAYSAVPLYISFFAGLITCLFAVILILYALVTKLFGLAAPGTSGVLIAIAFFNGIVLITNGVIGVYIARIYYEVKSRPRYIVKDVLRHKPLDGE
jgi:glycosyltransferase involved in cell wall biosynthesis